MKNAVMHLHTAISRLLAAGYLVKCEIASEPFKSDNGSLGVIVNATVIVNGNVFVSDIPVDTGASRRKVARNQAAANIYQYLKEDNLLLPGKKKKKAPKTNKKATMGGGNPKLSTAYTQISRYFQLLENSGVKVSRTPTRMTSKGDGENGSTTAHMSITVNGKRYRAQGTISDGGKRKQRARVLAVTRLRDRVMADHGELD